MSERTPVAAGAAADQAGRRFRTAVQARDLDGAVAVLAPDVRMYSPISFRPFEGREVVREVLGQVLEVFVDFAYVDELSGEHTHALIFTAMVDGRQVEGLDHLRVGPDGLVSDFTVMVRPLSAAIALAQQMAPRVAHLKG